MPDLHAIPTPDATASLIPFLAPGARPPELILIAAPSGGGKTVLAERLLSDESLAVERVVTMTTRSPRNGERDGVDYHFAEFDAMKAAIERGEFLEHAEVHGELYGAPLSELARIRERGRIPIAILDVQGVRSAHAALPGRVLALFLLPDRLDVLRGRILDRTPEIAPERLERRLANAPGEVEAAHRMAADRSTPTLLVPNRDGRFDETVAAVRALLRSLFAAE